MISVCFFVNQTSVGEIRRFCRLQDEGQSLMQAAMSQMNLSAKAYHRILKLARTIADLSGSDESKPHIWQRDCTTDQTDVVMIQANNKMF